MQEYAARLVSYAFGTDEAIRMVMLSNALVANLASDRFLSLTVLRDSQMRVLKLSNSTMNPVDELPVLQDCWSPAPVKVGEEITMWLA